MKPEVTVVIPAHNRAGFLPEAIDSCIEQSGIETEVIVVDDASQDETRDVLAACGTSITAIHLEKSIERGAARNLGARSGSGRFVAFLDSDDKWYPDKLQRQLSVMNSAAVSITGIDMIDETGRPMGRTLLPPKDGHRQVFLFNPYPAGPSTLVIERELFLSLGGFPEERQVQGSEDWLFFMSLAIKRQEIAALREPLVHYRVHQNNFSADIPAVARSTWNATVWAETHGLVGDRGARRLRARTAGMIARQYARRGEWSPARDWFKRSWQTRAIRDSLKVSVDVALSTGKALLARDWPEYPDQTTQNPSVSKGQIPNK